MKLRVRKRSLTVVLAVFLAVIAGVSAVALRAFEDARDDAGTAGAEATGRIAYGDDSFRERKGLNTILLLGLDKNSSDAAVGSYNNTQQADFIALLVVDPDSKSCTVLHLNRDTMTDVPVLGVTGQEAGTKYEQLALAHTYGTGGADSCRNAVKAVSSLLFGVAVDHYVSLTMDAVPILNDLVGGVTVTLEDDLSAVDPLMTSGATLKLTGPQALAFIRSRTDVADGTNLSRMARQRAYMTAFLSQLALQEDPEGLLTKAYGQLSEEMVTDCSASYLSGLMTETVKKNDFTVLYPQGEANTANEYVEFYVDKDALYSLVKDVFAR